MKKYIFQNRQANYMSSRRLKAYAKMFGLRGRPQKLKAAFHTLIAAANGGLERPSIKTKAVFF